MDVDINRCEVHTRVERGITFYTAYSDQFMVPLGFVWGVRRENAKDECVFDVLGSYVDPNVRRQGVRSFLNRFIAEKNDVLITFGATDDGAHFMKAAGYKLDKTIGVHYIKGTKQRGR